MLFLIILTSLHDGFGFCRSATMLSKNLSQVSTQTTILPIISTTAFLITLGVDLFHKKVLVSYLSKEGRAEWSYTLRKRSGMKLFLIAS